MLCNPRVLFYSISLLPNAFHVIRKMTSCLTTIIFSVLCGKPSSTLEPTTRKRRLGDAVDFLVIWIDILEHLVSVATCARVASATVDYTTGGRLRELLFGLESHSLGEPWPDVLGVTITIVITGLFIMGLEVSGPIVDGV